MASIEIEYFALLREQAGKRQETLIVEGQETPASLYQRLAQTYGFRLGFEQVRVAVNDEFSRPDKLLVAGDKVAFIPPVSGG